MWQSPEAESVRFFLMGFLEIRSPFPDFIWKTESGLTHQSFCDLTNKLKALSWLWQKFVPVFLETTRELEKIIWKLTRYLKLISWCFSYLEKTFGKLTRYFDESFGKLSWENGKLTCCLEKTTLEPTCYIKGKKVSPPASCSIDLWHHKIMFGLLKKKMHKTHIWCEEEFYPAHGTFQGRSSDQEDRQHNVRQDCCDVNRLRSWWEKKPGISGN